MTETMQNPLEATDTEAAKKYAAERRTVLRILLHPVKRTMFDDLVTDRWVLWNAQKFSNAANLSGQIGFQLVEVQKDHIRHIADGPPCENAYQTVGF